MFKPLIAAAFAVTAATSAHGATVDFEDGQGCDNAFATITAGAAAEECTFSANGITASRSLVRSSERGDTYWTAVFNGVASAISIEMGDRSNDDDRLFLRAFDAAGSLLDETTYDSLGLNGEAHLLSLDVTGAASITFGVTADLGAGSGIFADNLQFVLEDTTAPVPLPAAGLLLLSGLAGAAALRRKG